MKRSLDYVQPPPARRPLKIFAFDPTLGRTAENRITVEVEYEPLTRGPQGSRLEVIDYDGANRCFYKPINLDDSAILIQGGLDPAESDPRFHQQMVYAVAMKVIENFDRALGRRFQFRSSRRLRLIPHAFQGANAFYDSRLLAVLFGYFPADRNNPGPTLPGQTVFTCLSHDIIAHEMTHAMVDRLRKHFMEPSNRDVAAFHEGFSDIVAIFQHFSFQDILRRVIQDTRSDLRNPTPLVDLASEFGYATGGGAALRTAVDSDGTRRPIDPTLYQTMEEPHERGAILVAAVFDAFFRTYQRRIKDLIRIATGGTGQLPAGDLHPDLVNRIATEASRTAQSLLSMCIRAFEYLPPVDITFGDYLRALVTADFELSPADEFGQRADLIEAFRLRGIYPDFVNSLAEGSLLWGGVEANELPDFPIDKLFTIKSLLESAYEFNRVTPFSKPAYYSAESEREIDLSESAPAWEEEAIEMRGEVRVMLEAYIRTPGVAAKLGLDPARKITVAGFHPVFRVNPRGQLLVEMVAQFTQKDETLDGRFGGVPVRGGATVVAAADGKVRYVISKPLPSRKISQAKQREAKVRLERQQAFVETCDRANPQLAWADDRYFKTRIAQTMNFSSLHSEIIR
ncbi:MAG: hypothetical protein HYR56_31745 [Acidobacteria bacterium]|nr:hypothetical protein [Acidobacteriota bacterium]MBI3427531.1 hypothetical protein [Acidobacteriota bacterium]